MSEEHRDTNADFLSRKRKIVLSECVQVKSRGANIAQNFISRRVCTSACEKATMGADSAGDLSNDLTAVFL